MIFEYVIINYLQVNIFLKFAKIKLRRSKEMTIIIKPTMIKKSTYLLVPKTIVEMTEIENDTEVILEIKNINGKRVLEYSIIEKAN